MHFVHLSPFCIYNSWHKYILDESQSHWREIFQRKNERLTQDLNPEPWRQMMSMLPQGHLSFCDRKVMKLCHFKMAARSSPKLFLFFSLQILAVDRSALLCQWDAWINLRHKISAQHFFVWLSVHSSGIRPSSIDFLKRSVRGSAISFFISL